MHAIDILGFMGALSLVTAYFLLQQKPQTSKNILDALNLFGSFGIGVNAYYHEATPSIVINVIWAIITIHAWAKRYKANHK